MCAYIWVQCKAMQYRKCPFKDRNWTTTPLCSAVLLGFYDAAFQDWGFLFDQTAAKVWHKLVDDSFLVYSVISPMNPLIYEWFHLSFKLKELKESIRVWVASVESVFHSGAVPWEKHTVTLLLCFYFTDPCLNHHCKKGKVCEVDESNTPMCVCQDPTTCPAAEGEFEHVSLKSPTCVETVNSSQRIPFSLFVNIKPQTTPKRCWWYLVRSDFWSNTYLSIKVEEFSSLT